MPNPYREYAKGQKRSERNPALMVFLGDLRRQNRKNSGETGDQNNKGQGQRAAPGPAGGQEFRIAAPDPVLAADFLKPDFNHDQRPIADRNAEQAGDNTARENIALEYPDQGQRQIANIWQPECPDINPGQDPKPNQ